jgi:hypothetical protein
MNKLFVVVLLGLGIGRVTCAQEALTVFATSGAAAQPGEKSDPSARGLKPGAFAAPEAARSFSPGSAPVLASFSGTSTNLSFDKQVLSAAGPDPLPATPGPPRFVFGGRDDFRWQLGLGLSVLRFRSSLYYATGIGTDTSITYYTNDWFGVEGRVTTAFSPTTYIGSHVKFAGYGAGPKIAWRTKKLEPFAHAIFGGVHVLPQSAAGNANGFEFQLGGGASYRFNPRFSARIIADWVRTRLFSQWQDDAQVAVEYVLHF